MKRLNRISCHIISFVFILCLGVQTLKSATTRIGFEDAIFPELAVSGRALALGGAYMAKVDDSSAPFYNPTGLGTVRGVKFHLNNLHFETNMGWMKVATGGKIADAVTSMPTALTMEGQRQKLNTILGIHISFFWALGH